jgi:hypothetical protein
MCEHYWLRVLMYAPGMSDMTLQLKNRYESKRSRDFFLYNWERATCMLCSASGVLLIFRLCGRKKRISYAPAAS